MSKKHTIKNVRDLYKVLLEKKYELWEKFKSTKFAKGIPNFFTWTRIIASVAAPICFLSGHREVAVGLWIGGAASDAIDGFAARKLDASSEFGRKLDAVSDKIFALSILAPVIILGNFFMLVPLALESLISYVNLKGQKLGFEPKTTKVGKIKTIALFPTIILGVLSLITSKLYWGLIPMLGLTTYLQVKTFKEYKQDFDKNLLQRTGDVPASELTLKEETQPSATPSLKTIPKPEHQKPLHAFEWDGEPTHNVAHDGVQRRGIAHNLKPDSNK